MALVAPVNLPYNVKTLWFDPEGLDLHVDDKVVVETARGLELGVVASDIIEVPYEDVKKLKSPLKPVKRVATEEDLKRAEEMEQKSREAMPIFKQMAREHNEDMHPVSVEYMLDGDKAVFYFESEERIDFRDLVRKLASEFHVRIDMRQIGVRDEARIVGGIAHCGQLVCCKRLGGEFKPVSIRMAKDQDLSLNPQKISGLCGRLMCCLRYEEDVYKEFKKVAPKVGAEISTPAGNGKVVEYDVPRDTVSIRVEDEKPVKIPVSDVTDLSEDRKSGCVSDEAWEQAVEEAQVSMFGGTDLFSAVPAFTGEDKLGTAKAVHHEQSKKEKPARSSKRGSSRRGGGKSSGEGDAPTKRQPRRRSTTIKAADGAKATTDDKTKDSGNAGQRKQGSGGQTRSKNQKKSQGQKQGGLRPGHKSSGLNHGNDGVKPDGSKSDGGSPKGTGNRRRRRRRSSGNGGSGQGAQGQSSQGQASSSDAPTGE